MECVRTKSLGAVPWRMASGPGVMGRRMSPVGAGARRDSTEAVIGQPQDEDLEERDTWGMPGGPWGRGWPPWDMPWDMPWGMGIPWATFWEAWEEEEVGGGTA